MLNQDTISEATALLQRMLRGERAPDAKSRAPGRVSVPAPEPPTIDAVANDVEEKGTVRAAQRSSE